ncbi:MAG: cytochrome c family protein [Deltaproteobacteria bacterium]|nr:cytochrome c family protein [Deltaproteobacteria bacterium]
MMNLKKAGAYSLPAKMKHTTISNPASKGALISGKWAALMGLALFLMFAACAAQAQNALKDEDVAKIEGGDQPIKFSHRIHAGVNQIPCQYCHIYARRSWVAGAPPVSVCAGCHQTVNPDLAEVKKVMKHWEEKKPIEWVRIHDTPDFVRFPHWKHVTASNEVFPNGVPCQKCHGPIETLDVVTVQEKDFGRMGWCMKCHLTLPGTMERKRAFPVAEGSPRTANDMHPKGYHRPLMTDCLTCHK